MIGIRKRTVLIVLTILGLGLVATGLSALYSHYEYEDIRVGQGMYWIYSYGYPLDWLWYSEQVTWSFPGPKNYWFSVGYFLTDIAFWSATAFFVCYTLIRSVNTLHERRGSKDLSVINT
jgi:hypothetical protein